MASCRLALIVLVCAVVAAQSQRRQITTRGKFGSQPGTTSVTSQASSRGRSSFSRASTSKTSSRRSGPGFSRNTSQLSARAGGSTSGRSTSSRASSTRKTSGFPRRTSQAASKPASTFGRARASTSTAGSRSPAVSPFSRQKASTTTSGSRSSFGASRRKQQTTTRQSSSRATGRTGAASRTPTRSSSFNRGASAFSRGSSGSNRGASTLSRGSSGSSRGVSAFSRGSATASRGSRTRTQTRPQTSGSRGQFRSGAQKNKLLKKSSSVNFNCPEPDGFFADKGQCDKYYECKDGVAKEHMCPDGLLFHPERTYPCVYPIEANCQGRSAQQDAQPTEGCPRQFATFKAVEDPSCGAFTRCINGRAYRSGCPEGLAFDARTLGCEYADEVDGCDAPERAKATAECPRQFGRYALPGAGCQRYKVCVKGEAWEMTCPGNLMWNQANHMCDYPDMVQDECAEAYLGFQCPQREFTAAEVGEFTREAHPSDCTKYYICVNKEDGSVQPRLQGCPEPSVFDPSKAECNDQPLEVAGCEDVIPATVLAAFRQRDDDEKERRANRLAQLRAKLQG